MAIPDEDVARVRAATDLVALISEHTALKRVGQRFVGLCPFHAERSPSFSVNAQEGLYYCFGCQVRGDAITFVRAIEGCDFVEAVERLAGLAGITIRDDENPAAAAERGRRRDLLEVVQAAADFYHERLLHHRDAGRARQYLRARGYDGESVRRFHLGFAPAGRDELVRALRRPGALLRTAGLAHEGARGGLQDTLRERVIFPIFDPAGRPIALGGRVLPDELRRARGDPGPKYRNSPESPIYQKRRTLYGLNWAKAEIARTGEAVICEGYTDVIGFFSAGVARAVATCGTSLTEEHLRLLGRFARRIVLCFDADAAGETAAARLYEWERRHELELRVASLPPGADPAELARTDPDALAAAVQGARPFLGFQVARALDRADLHSPEGKARAVAQALEAIAAHPNELVRDEYLLLVADRTRQTPDRLRPLLDAAQRDAQRDTQRARSAPGEPSPRGLARPGSQAPRSRRETTSADAARNRPEGDEPPPYDDSGRFDDDAGVADDAAPRGGRPSVTVASSPAPARARRRNGEGPRPGRDALLLAIHRPAEVAELLEEACFVDDLQRAGFRALGAAASLPDAISAAEPAVAELLTRLAHSDGAEDLDVAGTVIAAIRHAGEAALAGLLADVRMVERTDAASDDEPARRLAALSEATSWVKSTLVALNERGASETGTAAALSHAEALLAWLVQRQAQAAGSRLEA
jgi:DNA primase